MGGVGAVWTSTSGVSRVELLAEWALIERAILVPMSKAATLETCEMV